jgi:hypothetical protein
MEWKPLLEKVLAREQAAEHEVVARAGLREDLPSPDAWQAYVYVGHFGYWRQLFSARLKELLHGRPVSEPPEDVEAENVLHMRADEASSIDELVLRWRASWDLTNEVVAGASERDLAREPEWYGAPTSGVAIVRNSYTHPADHLVDFWIDRGGVEVAAGLCDELSALVGELAAEHPRFPAGEPFYRGLAAALRGDEAAAVSSFKKATSMRADIADTLREERRLAFVREYAGLQELLVKA